MQKAVEVNKSFYDDHWAGRWKARFMYDPVSKRNIALDCLKRADAWPKNQRVLDVGFGFGLILFALDRSNTITGVELSESAVRHAGPEAERRGFTGARFVLYSGEGALPLDGASYDLILCSHVLEHVPDDGFLLSEMARLLAPGGRIFLNVPINEEHFNDPHHVRKYTPDAFLRLLAGRGFDVVLQQECDRLWDSFGRFFEKGYHEWPVVGFPLSSALNVSTSMLPYGLARFVERLLPGTRPRQFATVSKVRDSGERTHVQK